MRLLTVFFSLFLLLFSSTPLQAQSETEDTELTAEQQAYIEQLRQFWESLDRQTGAIELPNGVATLQVPESFYYLNPQDAERVLVDVWGNPPGQNTLGMLFPAGVTPFDSESWAVTIEYEQDGYVSDENADSIDYSELLTDMQASTRESSKERVKQGYEAIELIGWAAPPHYDQGSHKMYWAKEIKFGDSLNHTLNYNIRVLGRQGVLVLNFIAGMEQKRLIENQLDQVLAIAEFNQGSRYEDFNPDLDEVAAYGIGALVAGKVAAKTGLLAAALIFLKKFGVYIVVGLGALLAQVFKRKKSAE